MQSDMVEKNPFFYRIQEFGEELKDVLFFIVGSVMQMLFWL